MPVYLGPLNGPKTERPDWIPENQYQLKVDTIDQNGKTSNIKIILPPELSNLKIKYPDMIITNDIINGFFHPSESGFNWHNIEEWKVYYLNKIINEYKVEKKLNENIKRNFSLFIDTDFIDNLEDFTNDGIDKDVLEEFKGLDNVYFNYFYETNDSRSLDEHLINIIEEYSKFSGDIFIYYDTDTSNMFKFCSEIINKIEERMAHIVVYEIDWNKVQQIIRSGE